MSLPRIEDLVADWLQTSEPPVEFKEIKRTPECLRYSQLPAAADPNSALAIAKQPHTETCPWCQRALRSQRRLTAMAASGEEWEVPEPEIAEASMAGLPGDSMSFDDLPGDSQGDTGEVNEALRDFVQRWFVTHQPQQVETPAAYIDAAGNLRVVRDEVSHMQVRLVLMAGDARVVDQIVNVHQGRVDETIPLLQRWGLRDLAVPEEALQLIPVDAATLS